MEESGKYIEALFADVATFQPFIFDGFEWGLVQFNAAGIPFLWMAYHARRGDKIAAQLLNLWNVKIYALGQKLYWPIEFNPNITEEIK